MPDIVVGPVEVPDVVGLEQFAAEAQIIAAYFEVAYGVPQYSDTVPAGSVISQDPAGESEADPGSIVTLVLSLGAEPGLIGFGGPMIVKRKQRRRSRRQGLRIRRVKV